MVATLLAMYRLAASHVAAGCLSTVSIRFAVMCDRVKKETDDGFEVLTRRDAYAGQCAA